MSGKSTIWQILEKAMNRLTLTNGEKYRPVKIEKMNPKSIEVKEYYGDFDDSPDPQWMMGIFSTLLKTMIAEDNKTSRWLLMDGPVDTLWIENMNSLLDDSKLLTLNNGDRIPLAQNCKLLFETENLDVASPATISRVGLLYMDLEELGY
jgi:dynein heavy chain